MFIMCVSSLGYGMNFFFILLLRLLNLIIIITTTIIIITTAVTLICVGECRGDTKYFNVQIKFSFL
jgi:hypothetical protein